MLWNSRAVRLAATFCLFVLPWIASAEDAVRIYVYSLRESAVRSKLAISLDGSPVARLKRGTFFGIDTTTGRHVISCNKGVPLFVDLRRGHEAFVRLGAQTEVGEPSTVVFDNIHPRVASQEMRSILYIDAKGALAASVPKADPRPEPDVHFRKRQQSPEN
jgi:hypothetical protein